MTSSLATNIMERLSWLETVFRLVNPRVSVSQHSPRKLANISQHSEIREVAGKILEILSQRLEGEYMRIAEEDPQNLALRKIPGLARQARELKSRAQ